MVRHADQRLDGRVGLRRADEPIRELGIEARDLCVERRGIRIREYACCFALGAMMLDDHRRDDSVQRAGGERRGSCVPELRDCQLLRRSRIRKCTDLREIREERSRAKPRRRRRPDLAR